MAKDIFIISELKKFINDETSNSLNFPTNFTKEERKTAHKLAEKFGLKSKSYGSGEARYLMVSKKPQKITKELTLTKETVALLSNIANIQCADVNENIADFPYKENRYVAYSQQVVPKCLSVDQTLLEFREKLPIAPHISKIAASSVRNSVVIVSGETGSGKTTQVPQGIIEFAHQYELKTNVICSLPRRIAAVANCERVAAERDDPVGHQTGYKIRLENRTSSDTNITYCTNGILLKNILAGDAFLSSVSHLIIDEVHERERLGDFTLTILKQILPKYPDLRIILMSATMDTEKLSKYFKDIPEKGHRCPVIEVTGRMHKVQYVYLESVLNFLKYKTLSMEKILEESGQKIEFDDSKDNLLKKVSDCDAEASAEEGLQRIALCPKDEILLSTYEKAHREDINNDIIFQLIKRCHENMPKGHILVFLPGYEEISSLKRHIEECIYDMKNYDKILIYTLHSKMQTSDQRKVLQKVKKSLRKVILATNIAQTSVTIDDVRIVIDTGKCKERFIDDNNGACRLSMQWISAACAKQRAGRAGRTAPGICFRLFSSEKYSQMDAFKVPEILTEPLEELCLKAKRVVPKGMSLQDFLAQAPDPPSTSLVELGIETLKKMEALDNTEELTCLGTRLLEIDVDPHFGKMLIFSILLKCVGPILDIVAWVVNGDPFRIPPTKQQKQQMTEKHVKISQNSLSDHMVYIQLLEEYRQAELKGNEYKWCGQNHISYQIMKLVKATRHQILNNLNNQLLSESWQEQNANSRNWAVVKAAITAGLYPNIMKKECGKYRTDNVPGVELHNSSILKTLKTKITQNEPETTSLDWIAYEDLQIANNRTIHARSCTAVGPVAVCLFAGQNLPDQAPYTHCAQEDESNSKTANLVKLHLDKRLYIVLEQEEADQILSLQKQLKTVVAKKLKTPHLPFSQDEERLINSVVKILTIEEKISGQKQPDLPNYQSEDTTTKSVGESSRPPQNHYRSSSYRSNYKNARRN